MEQFRKDFGQPYEGDYVLPAKWQLAFTAASTIGLLIGGPPATFLAKRWGRRAVLAMGYGEKMFYCVVVVLFSGS